MRESFFPGTARQGRRAEAIPKYSEEIASRKTTGTMSRKSTGRNDTMQLVP
jgi:hypothetical protein